MSEDRDKHDRSGGKAKGGFKVGSKDPVGRKTPKDWPMGQDVPKGVLHRILFGDD